MLRVMDMKTPSLGGLAGGVYLILGPAIQVGDAETLVLADSQGRNIAGPRETNDGLGMDTEVVSSLRRRDQGSNSGRGWRSTD